MPGLKNALIEGMQLGQESDIPIQIFQREKEFAEDIKARYEAQVIAHKRTERKQKEIEKHLEMEQRKFKFQQAELVKQLEEERIARKTLDAILTKLKDDFTKQELQKDKTHGEIEVSYDQVKRERDQLKLAEQKLRYNFEKEQQL